MTRETTVRAGIVDVLVLAQVPATGSAPDAASAVADGAPEAERVRWQVLALRRGADTRCTGAWEIVHGRIERDERPDVAALRELREETGLEADRLYSITVNPFYLVQTDSVELAVVFAAIVSHGAAAALSSEHDAWEWLTPADALARLAWPRERDALTQALSLLRTGDAGPVEDVLRVR